LQDWTWPAALVKEVLTQNQTFYWKYIHGSSTVFFNGQSGTGVMIQEVECVISLIKSWNPF